MEPRIYTVACFTFRPECWIVDNKTGITKDDVDVAKAAFCAFSLGPRGFIDMPIVYMEVALTLAHLLWAYDMRSPEDATSTEPSRGGRVYAKHSGLEVEGQVSVSSAPSGRERWADGGVQS